MCYKPLAYGFSYNTVEYFWFNEKTCVIPLPV